jgi:predicted DNA-binding protein
MPTLKKRINISVSPAVEEAVTRLAKRDAVPEATKVSELLTLALELEEDIFFSNLVHKRLSKKQKWISHNVTWK